MSQHAWGKDLWNLVEHCKVECQSCANVKCRSCSPPLHSPVNDYATASSCTKPRSELRAGLKTQNIPEATPGVKHTLLAIEIPKQDTKYTQSSCYTNSIPSQVTILWCTTWWWFAWAVVTVLNEVNSHHKWLTATYLAHRSVVVFANGKTVCKLKGY